MNTRVSQFELRPSVEPDSSRAESFASQPERSFATGSTNSLAADSSKATSSFGSESVLAKSERLSSRIPFYLIGLLLTATAIAKFWMLLTDSFADVRVGIPKEILWLSVAFELWLAFENFRLRDYRVMAFVNTIVFSSFGIFASIRLAMGYTSCGCSGRLELPAWIFILTDFAVVASFSATSAQRIRFTVGFSEFLLFLKNHFLQVSDNAWQKLSAIAGVFVAILCCAMVSGVFSKQPVVARYVDIGEINERDLVTTQVLLTNVTGDPIRLVGISRSCTCMTLETMSQVIPAKENLTFSVALNRVRDGNFHYRLRFFLDHPRQFSVDVDVLGKWSSFSGEKK